MVCLGIGTAVGVVVVVEAGGWVRTALRVVVYVTGGIVETLAAGHVMLWI